jgi:hypothetical protein
MLNERNNVTKAVAYFGVNLLLLYHTQNSYQIGYLNIEKQTY